MSFLLMNWAASFKLGLCYVHIVNTFANWQILVCTLQVMLRENYTLNCNNHSTSMQFVSMYVRTNSTFQLCVSYCFIAHDSTAVDNNIYITYRLILFACSLSIKLLISLSTHIKIIISLLSICSSSTVTQLICDRK